MSLPNNRPFRMIKSHLRKPQLASSKREDPKLFDAVREVGNLLPKSTGLFVALSGIAYFSGWRQRAAYYEKLGAPWITASLSRFSFIEVSAGMLFLTAIFAYGTLFNLATSKRDPNKVFWGGSVTLIVAFALQFVSICLPKDWVAPSALWGLHMAYAGLVYVAAGVLLGEAIAKFRDQKLRWSPGIAEVIYTVVTYSLYMTPADVGRARAEFHMAAPERNLPAATVINSVLAENWRLVEVLGQMALLADFSKGQSQPIFRVVLLKDISGIRPPAQINAEPSPQAAAKPGKSAVSGKSIRQAESPR
jgi:hypothetical protein